MAAPFIGAANIIIWLYQRPVGDLDHLVWPIKKISSTIPANICCLLSIKVGHHLWLIYNKSSKHTLFANHKNWSPFYGLYITNPANIRCLLIIKIGRHFMAQLRSGHIGANNLFPNVMQIVSVFLVICRISRNENI